MVDVTRRDFESKLPLIKALIERCSFISVDTEFTALNSTGSKHR